MKEAITSRIAANLRAERARAGIGQKELADRMHALGFTSWVRQTVGAAENGHRHLMAAELVGIALCLGCRVERLLDGCEL